MPVTADADEVGELIAQGALRRALDRYRGPLLPRSEAPGVVELLVAWTARPEHADDVEMLQAARDALPPGSPRALLLDARLRRALW